MESDIVIKKIGEGGYGKVYLVLHKGEKLARKEIKITPENMEEVVKEINILQSLKDRNILIMKYFNIVEEENICYIYTEYVENGDLWRIIDEKREKREDFTVEVYIIYLFIIDRK